MGNKRGIKELRVSYSKKYLLRKMVKFFSADGISVQGQEQLRNLVKQTSTFQTKKHKIGSIGTQDLMRLRLEVEKIVFVDNADVDLVEKHGYTAYQQSILKDLAESYEDNKEYAKAIECYKYICYKYIVDSPDFLCLLAIDEVHILQKLARLYELLHDKANECKILETIVSYLCVDDLEKICDYYKEIEPGKSKKFLIYLANMHRFNGHYKEAIEYYKQILEIEAEVEKQIAVLYYLIHCYTQFKDNPEIERCYECILSLPNLRSKQKYIGLSKLGKFYNGNGDYVKEIETYEQMLQIAGISILEKLQIFDLLIGCYRKTKNTRKEIEIHEQILNCSNISPGRMVGGLCSLAKLQCDDKDKVVVYYRRAFRITEVSKELRLNVIVDWLGFSHRSEVAVEPSDLLEILSVLEGVYAHAKKMECCRLLGKQRDLPYAVLDRLAGIYRKMNKVLEEIACCGGILEMSELGPDCYLNTLKNLVTLYKRTNNIVKARECYKRILSFPEAKLEDQYVALSYLGEEYSSTKGKTRKAIICYESILENLGKVSGAECYALRSLANIYNRTKRDAQAIKCYDRIIESPRIDRESKLQALKELAILCAKVDYVDREIQCYEDMLKYSEMPQKDYDDVIRKLITIYNHVDDNDMSLKGLERMLNFPRIALSDMHAIFNSLIKFYGRTKDIRKEIESCERNLKVIDMLKSDSLGMLEHLVDLYEQIEASVVKRINCYDQILKLSKAESKKLDVLNKLITLYAQMNDNIKQIGCYESILLLRDVKQSDRIEALKALIFLYLATNNERKAIACKNEVLKLDGSFSRELEIFLIFLNDVKYGLDQKVIRLINARTEVESAKILQILSKNSWLCFDRERKLKIEQWIILLESTDVIGDLECLVLQSLLEVVGIKRDCFFNDKTMPEWNILVTRKCVITDDDWDIVLIDIGEIFDDLCEENKSQRDYLFKFFSQCMAARDAATKLGKQALRKRLAATVDYLKELKTYCDVSNTEGMQVKKMIKGALAIMSVGGMKCTDRAVTFVADLENYIMILKNPSFLANVMVRRFKFEIIMQALIDPYYNEVGQDESVETYLSYTLKFNRILGLGLPEGGSMAHESTAKTLPLEEAVAKLNKFLTMENLLNFTATQYVFQIQFEAQKEAALEEPREKYGEAFEAENNELAAELAQKLKEIEEGFYKDIARKLYLEAGFLFL